MPRSDEDSEKLRAVAVASDQTQIAMFESRWIFTENVMGRTVI